MTLHDCIAKHFADPDFITRFDAEHGTNLSHRGNAMEVLIYQVGGQMQKDVCYFIDYMVEHVWPGESQAIIH